MIKQNLAFFLFMKTRMTILYFEKHITRKSFVLLILFLSIGFSAVSQLKADFTASVTGGCTPLFVQFSDQSTGNPTEWSWDLGNGTKPAQKNPGVIYTDPGTYTIKLVVKNSTGIDSVVKTAYISVYAKPIIDFSATPKSGCYPLLVKFTDKTNPGSGTSQSWFWDFGDGLNSTDQNPEHVYKITDTFSVTLRVTNSDGCTQTGDKKSFISVADTIQSDFDFTYDNVCVLPSVIRFSNKSQSDVPLTYSWSFGDGVTSPQTSPTHSFSVAGTYQVKLISRNSDGCSDTAVKTVSVGMPKAEISFPASACVDQSILFKDSSNPGAINGTWNFGDLASGTGLSVTHAYSSPGIYVITYKGGFGGCSNMITRSIEIVDTPGVSFISSSALGKCNGPLQVQFVNTSSGSGTYVWDFGDGTTSSEVNPLHEYTNTGKYTVALTVNSSKGLCRNTIIMPDFVKIGAPVINGFVNMPFSGCISSIVNFEASIDSPEPIVSYLWNFGDGTTSAEANPTHEYLSAGSYAVSLEVKTIGGCSAVFTLTDAVSINNKPTVNFTANPLEACASGEIHFADLTSGKSDAWLWKFGDGTESTDHNPVHKYNDTGYFSVALFAYNNGCRDSLLITDFIHINPPAARFQTVINCSQKLQRTFKDLSVGSLEWNWNFGDGNTDTIQSPVHNYADTGRYDVTLIVSNGVCTDTATNTIKIINEKPTFSVESFNRNYCKYDSVKFAASNYYSSNINGFKWGFGDDSTTNFYTNRDSVVYYKYQAAGTYIPVLYTVDKNNCKDSTSLSHTINIYGPTALFSNLEGICRGKDFIFSDESTSDGSHVITNWFWNYGDGMMENLASGPFKHFYSDTGTYNVTLIVTDNNSCTDTLYKPGAVIIAAPVASFKLADTVKCTQNRVIINNNSVGINLVYKWDFGDGGTSTSSSPVYIYKKEGIYSINLNITDRFGCQDSMYQANIITISNPIASFSISDSVATCPPLEVMSKNYSKNYQSVLWDFGDGNTSDLLEPSRLYNLPGNYNLQLIVHGYGECYDTASSMIRIKGPNGIFTYTPSEACYPVKVSFNATTQNTASFIWDFGDGGIELGMNNQTSYTYKSPGSYVPKIILKDNSGCQVAIVNPDTLRISGVQPKFAATSITGCDSSLAIFSDSTIFTAFDPIRTRFTSFGDGASSSDVNPEHYYKTSGTFNVEMLLETNLGCTGSYKLPVTVTVKQAPSIVSVIPDSACLNTDLNFYANEATNLPYNLAWHWEFGNNASSDIQNPVYNYDVPGLYMVNLVVDASNGCSDTSQHLVTILAPPNTDAGVNASICLNTALTLQPSGASSYNWDPAPTISCTKCANPVVQPVANTTYYVNGSDDFGCIRRDSLQIQVIQPVIVDVNVKSDTLCAGSSVLLKASGAEKYQWIPASGLSDPNSANPVASPVATILYRVIGSDSKNCFTDTADVNVLVSPLPTFNITDSVVTAGAGSSYTIKTQNSPDVVSWIWQPAYNLSCTNCAQPLTVLKTNVTYSAQAINRFGCTATDNIRIEVTCNNSNVFIPNTFSPNNDSRNDYFYPQGRGLFNIKSMKIFNRWGVMVYSKANFTANSAADGWDGKYAGSEQPSGVYVYMIDVACDNGTVLTYKGDITLIR